MRGKQFTYALLDERAPQVPALERDQALLELTRRYFAARGPASAHDFAWWSGLSLSDVKRGIQIAGDELTPIDIDQRRFWLSAEARPLPKRKPTAHLLPNYDEYFIGFKDRSAVGQRIKSVSAVVGGNAVMAHVVVLDGQLVGGWKRTFAKGDVLLTLNLVTAATPAERRNIVAAARRFGEFLGSHVEVRGLR